MDPRRCVVLVPFTGFIHRECDLALRELERRGYAVRRVAGYAAIDQGRNQLATDALLEGYEETLWIDSDVGFNPDDVDKLRRHNLPMTCGIYPQKGKRALACHVASGGKTMRFGKDGGLVELLYAGTGFLHIRREVYAAVQRRLQLPMCNERFGHPMIPFFQPMIRVIEEAHWYLAEDYGFCERARQAGFQIFADTTIRLWHIGLYRYGWEDAGRDPERFAGFTLNFNDQRPTAVASAPRTPRLQELTMRYPWPDLKPVVPPPPPRNWLFPSTQEMLAKCVPRDARIVIELGSFTGRSTRFLVEHASQATILAVDHWQGSDDMHGDAEVMAFLPRLYETFLAECWLFRDRIVPIRRKTIEALQEIADLEIVPDAVYVDADHSYEAVRDDVEAVLRLFPQTVVVGDDWNWEGVQRAVTEVAQRHGYRVEAHGVGWRLAERTRPAPA